MMANTKTSASAAFATNDNDSPTRFKRNDLFRSSAITSLAAVCYISMLAIGSSNDNGVIVVSAFALSYHRTSPSSPITIIHRVNSIMRHRETRLAYKHLENDNDESNDATFDDNTNKTALGSDKSIYYNDLEAQSSSSGINDNSIRKLEATKEQKNSNLPKKIKAVVLPIQMIKKVPKVTPIHMSTAVFLKLIGDPQWSSKTRPSNSPPTTQTRTDKKSKKDKKVPKIQNWKTQIKQQPKQRTVFHATSYLESLNPNSRTPTNTNGNDDDELNKALRDLQANITNTNLESTHNAFVEATRRTNATAAAQKRIDEMQSKPQWKERCASTNLEREKLEREFQRKEREIQAQEQEEIIGGKGTVVSEESLSSQLSSEEDSHFKCKVMPVLDILTSLSSKSLVDDPPPLLIGSALTIEYSTLTPYQKRALGVALQINHEDNEGGIVSVPIIAVVDSHTASVMDSSPYKDSLPSQQSSIDGSTTRRYATVTSIELVHSSNGEESHLAVKLMGVGRVFLHDYFPSKDDAGVARDEEDLSKLLAQIEELDGLERHDEMELPVVMAKFDLFLDNSITFSDSNESSARKVDHNITRYRDASSRHAVTDLYQTANKVYRLHEERKKLVAGVNAGMIRLHNRRRRTDDSDSDDNYCFDFEDSDGLVLTDDDYTTKVPPSTLGVSEYDVSTNIPRSYLATLDTYGLGSYGGTIPDLTSQLTPLIEPFYSQSHRDREEYNAELASMVIFLTLEEYATPPEVATALLAPSAMERLKLGYRIMMRHVGELKGLVGIVCDELMEFDD